MNNDTNEPQNQSVAKRGNKRGAIGIYPELKGMFDSKEPPKITFISEKTELEQNGSDTCIIKSTNSKEIDICAILELNNLHTVIYSLF